MDWFKERFISLVFLVVMGVCAFMYCKQKDDCSKKHCEVPAHVQVVGGECVCLAPAKP